MESNTEKPIQTPAAQGVVLGASYGGIIGAGLGALVVGITGLGEAVATGPLVPVAVGIVAGGVAGALLGGLGRTESSTDEDSEAGVSEMVLRNEIAEPDDSEVRAA